MLDRATYDYLTSGLLQGPRQKSDATIDLENIALAFLNPNLQVICRFNVNAELEIVAENQTYNLTNILKSHPDFEHFEFANHELDEYVKFYNTSAKNLPATVFDLTKQEHHKIHLAEKLAIHLYTGTFYQKINDFLRLNNEMMSNLKQLNETDLAREIKEIVLATVIASHGLNRTSEEENISDTFIQLDRKEVTVSGLNKTRIASTQSNQPIISEGFTSTTQSTLTASSPQTIITYTIPANQISIKNISALSWVDLETRRSGAFLEENLGKKFTQENEVLFPPNMQTKFYGCAIKSNDRYFFQAIIVRSIDSAHANSYVSQEASHCRELFKLARALPSINSFSLHTLNNLEALIKRYSGGKTKMYSSVLQSLITAIYQKKLMLHSQAVRDRHLLKPFEHPSCDDAVILNGKTYYKPNHDGSHGDRVSVLVLAVIKYYAQFAADPAFKAFCQALSADDIANIQLAMLFSVSGRESETGHSDNAKLYFEYKKTSANNFREYAREINMSSENIEKFAQLIEYMCNSFYVEGKISEIGNILPEYQHIFHIMNLAHNADLLRCVSKVRFECGIEFAMKINNQALPKEDSVAAKKALTQLLKLADANLAVTGCRQFLTFKDDELIEKYSSYDKKIFPACTISAQECLTKLSAVTDLTPEATANQQPTNYYATDDDNKSFNTFISLLRNWNEQQNDESLNEMMQFLATLSIDLNPSLEWQTSNSKSTQELYQQSLASKPDHLKTILHGSNTLYKKNIPSLTAQTIINPALQKKEQADCMKLLLQKLSTADDINIIKKKEKIIELLKSNPLNYLYKEEILTTNPSAFFYEKKSSAAAATSKEAEPQIIVHRVPNDLKPA